MSEYRLIVGLGNPGKKYEMTRHNIGYLIVQGLAHKWGWSFKEDKRLSALAAKGVVGDVTVHLLLPTTFMNESGRAVRRTVDYYKIDPSSVFVVTDDIALDFGQFRLKTSGSSGGHNGLKSIESHLGTSQYDRLRVGIGDRKHGELADYVLSTFSSEEVDQLPKVIKQGADIVIRSLTEDMKSVMNDVNRRNKMTQNNIPQNGVGELK